MKCERPLLRIAGETVRGLRTRFSSTLSIVAPRADSDIPIVGGPVIAHPIPYTR